MIRKEPKFVSCTGLVLISSLQEGCSLQKTQNMGIEDPKAKEKLCAMHGSNYYDNNLQKKRWDYIDAQWTL